VCLAEDVANSIQDENGNDASQNDSRQGQAYESPAPVARDATIQGKTEYCETDGV